MSFPSVDSSGLSSKSSKVANMWLRHCLCPCPSLWDYEGNYEVPWKSISLPQRVGKLFTLQSLIPSLSSWQFYWQACICVYITCALVTSCVSVWVFVSMCIFMWKTLSCLHCCSSQGLTCCFVPVPRYFFNFSTTPPALWVCHIKV